MKKIKDLTINDNVFIIDLDKSFGVANLNETQYPKYPNNLSIHKIKKITINSDDVIYFFDNNNSNTEFLKINLSNADCSVKYVIEYLSYGRMKSFVVISDESILEERLRIIGMELLSKCDEKLKSFEKQMEKEKAQIRKTYWQYLNNLKK
jgi:hypothetical protein